MSVSIPILTNDPSLLIMFRIGCQKPPNQLINGCWLGLFSGMNAEMWRSAFCQKNIILPMTTPLIDDVPIIMVLYSYDFHIEPKYKMCLSLWPSSLESGHFHQLGVRIMWSSLAVAVSDPMCRIPCSGWWLQIFLMCGLDFFFIPFPEKKTPRDLSCKLDINASDIPYKSGCVFSFLLNRNWFQKTSWL